MEAPILTAIITGAVSLLVAYLTYLGGKRSATAQNAQAKSDENERILNQWRTFAEDMGDAREKLEAKVEDLSKKVSEQGAAISQLQDVLNFTQNHLFDWWDWYDKGANPPPPVRPPKLVDIYKQKRS